MNILLISNLYPEPSEYGISPDTKAVHYFAVEWIKQGHNVLVLHPYFNSVRKISRFFRHSHIIKEYCIDNIHVIFGESQIIVPFQNSSSKLQQKQLAKKFHQYMDKHYPGFIPDRVVVHFPVISPFFNDSFLNKDISYGTLHGIDISTIGSLHKRKRKQIVTYLNNAYTDVYYRSRVLSEQGAVYGIKSNGNNLILSGIDRSLIAPEDTILSKLARHRTKLKLIFAGKINKQKRIDSILYALSQIKDSFDFSLTIVGDGPELEILYNLSVELGLSDKILFVGKKKRDEVSKYMSMSDVFIMISKGETFGLVYLEAMGQGCLTIGSKGEGIDGVISSGLNGFLCTPENVDEISQTLIKVASLDSSKFNKIALAGYNTVTQMSSEKMAKQYLDMLGVK